MAQNEQTRRRSRQPRPRSTQAALSAGRRRPQLRGRRRHHGEIRVGPNGALIMAADLIADEIENLTRDIEEAHADFVDRRHAGTNGALRLPRFRTIHRQRVNKRTQSHPLPLRRSLLREPTQLRLKHVPLRSSLQPLLPATATRPVKNRFNPQKGRAGNYFMVS